MVNNPLSSEEIQAIMQTFNERTERDFTMPIVSAQREFYQFDFFETTLEE